MRHIFYLIAIELICLQTSPASYGFGKPKVIERKWLMGAMGDSISAATFADTSVLFPQEMTPSEIARQKELAQEDPANLVHSNFLFENRSTLSWASGEKITSHFQRLKAWIDRFSGGRDELEVMNVAVPGNVSSHMEGQAQKLVDAMKSGQYSGLKYVTFLIGANDACSGKLGGTPDDELASNVYKAFAKLAEIRQSEPIKILVSSIPRIPDLGFDSIKNTTTIAFLSCEFARANIFKFCPNLIRWNNQGEYAERVGIVIHKNQVIEQTAERARKDFPGLQIAISHSFYEASIQSKFLAMDCFHPNAKGQQLLSDLTWSDQPWF